MLKRSITTIAILAFIIPVIIFGDYQFGYLPGEIFFLSSMVILSCYAAYEITSFLLSDELRKTVAISVMAALIVNSVIISFFGLMIHETTIIGGGLTSVTQIDPMWCLSFLPLLLIPGLLFFIEDNQKKAIFAFVIVIYTAWAFSMLFIDFVWGITALAWPMLITILMDTFAYFIGSMFGKHKIAPNTSPNKTWEGTIGGLSVAVTIGTIWAIFLMTEYKEVDAGIGIFITASVIVIGIIAFFGDLTFSKIKRTIGKKDFGSILPGHGGLFDRIDGHLFTIPTALISLIIITQAFGVVLY